MNILINSNSIKKAAVTQSIAQVLQNSTESTVAVRNENPSMFDSRFGRSFFGKADNSFGATTAQADNPQAEKSATQLVAWKSTTTQETKNGLLKINADPSSSGYQINPNTYDSINPLEYYGKNKFNADGFDFERAKRFDLPDTQVPNNSKLHGLLGTQAGTNELWNDIRKNLVAGRDGKGLFADDEHLNKALNETIDKFNAGPKSNGHDYQNAIRNNDVLSTVTAFRISEKGIHENGLGKLYEAYAKVDNALPDNIISSSYLQKFNQELKNNNGNVVKALAASKIADTTTYGILTAKEDQVKSFANYVNHASFKSMADSLGLDARSLEQTLKEKGGIDGENKFYDFSGAMALASAQDFKLLDSVDGKTGFQRLVEQSKAREDGKNHEAHVNFHIRPKGDAKTDGTAFLDFSQNGIEALASLQKHVGGLNSNPMLANQFSFGFQDEKNFREWAPKILEEMKKANIDVTKLGFNVEGHGSKENGAMIKSGILGGDYQGIGQGTSGFMADLLKNTPAMRQVDVKYDSCYGLAPATHNAEHINNKAKELGLNIAVNYEGSRNPGLVKSHVGGENNNQDRFTTNADGTLSATSQRKDDGGTDEAGVFYSKSPEEFNKRMQSISSAEKESNKGIET
jgi:hypothetical protein